MSLQRSGGYQIRREIGPDRTPGGPPIAYPKGVTPARVESGEAGVTACIATGGNTLTAMDVTAGATAIAWSHFVANEVIEGVSAAVREACTASDACLCWLG